MSFPVSLDDVEQQQPFFDLLFLPERVFLLSYHQLLNRKPDTLQLPFLLSLFQVQNPLGNRCFAPLSQIQPDHILHMALRRLFLYPSSLTNIVSSEESLHYRKDFDRELSLPRYSLQVLNRHSLRGRIFQFLSWLLSKPNFPISSHLQAKGLWFFQFQANH
ncbi:MAG: hypothetical protein DDT42_01435 [candidate division WS2 bacterium]|uniref:Uncharacterized protein n=1 Tax=Psychracetigena formicireducens TaxID=2986056 RepID=A0A9E2BHB8_PSYF1|nr:hypothetical protein [Candidatus Psychracetigena formicireducens]